MEYLAIIHPSGRCGGREETSEEVQKGEESQRPFGTQEATHCVSSVLPLHESRGEVFYHSCVRFNLKHLGDGQQARDDLQGGDDGNGEGVEPGT